MSIDARRYSYEGLRNIGNTLNATRVLSDSFAGDLFSMALQVASEAHAAGRELERKQNPAHDAEITRLRDALGAAKMQHDTYAADAQAKIASLNESRDNLMCELVDARRHASEEQLALNEEIDQLSEALENALADGEELARQRTTARQEVSRLRTLLEAERQRSAWKQTREVIQFVDSEREAMLTAMSTAESGRELRDMLYRGACSVVVYGDHVTTPQLRNLAAAALTTARRRPA